MTADMHSLRLSGPHGLDRLSLLGLLLTPVAVVAGAIAAWRFGVDAGWTRSFFVAGGFLSHWQVWFAFAIGVEACAHILSQASARSVRATL
jgi:hypothetical protein